MERTESRPLSEPQDDFLDEEWGIYAEKLAKALAQNDAATKKQESTEESKP